MLQVAVFAGLIATAGAICWYSRKPTVPLGFAVLFAIDGAYETMSLRYGGHASLAASVAIAFCALAWAMDRLSSERSS